jgi:hypothetical protein
MSISLRGRKSRARKQSASYMPTSQPFGISSETESSQEASLSFLHEDFIRQFMENEIERERAILEHWFASRPH